MYRGRIAAAAGLLVASLAAIGAVQEVSFKLKPKVGDSAEYKVTADYTSEQGPITFKETEVQKVKEVHADGSFTMDEITTGAEADVGGQTFAIPDATSTYELTPNGAVKSIKTADGAADGDAYRLANLIEFQPPDNAKIGDEGSYDIPTSKDHDSPAVKVTYKIEGTEKIGNWDTVKVSFTAQETEGDLKSSTSGTNWFCTADGSLVQSRGQWKNLKPPQAPSPLSGKYNLDRTK